jgi:hypothetical protein
MSTLVYDDHFISNSLRDAESSEPFDSIRPAQKASRFVADLLNLVQNGVNYLRLGKTFSRDPGHERFGIASDQGVREQ